MVRMAGFVLIVNTFSSLTLYLGFLFCTAAAVRAATALRFETAAAGLRRCGRFISAHFYIISPAAVITVIGTASHIAI